MNWAGIKHKLPSKNRLNMLRIAQYTITVENRMIKKSDFMLNYQIIKSIYFCIILHLRDSSALFLLFFKQRFLTTFPLSTLQYFVLFVTKFLFPFQLFYFLVKFLFWCQFLLLLVFPSSCFFQCSLKRWLGLTHREVCEKRVTYQYYTKRAESDPSWNRFTSESELEPDPELETSCCCLGLVLCRRGGLALDALWPRLAGEPLDPEEERRFFLAYLCVIFSVFDTASLLTNCR